MWSWVIFCTIQYTIQLLSILHLFQSSEVERGRVLNGQSSVQDKRKQLISAIQSETYCLSLCISCPTMSLCSYVSVLVCLCPLMPMCISSCVSVLYLCPPMSLSYVSVLPYLCSSVFLSSYIPVISSAEFLLDPICTYLPTLHFSWT